MVVVEEESVIIILDALGTKGKWNNPDNVKKYVESWENLTENWQKVLEDDGGNHNFKIKLNAFSDTIILSNTGTDMDRVIPAAAHNISLLMLDGISKNIFFRGCMSIGQVYSSDKMIIGKAIDEAAEYYTLPEWVGITATPSAYNAIQQLRKKNKLKDGVKDFFVNYDIPLKIGIEKGILINYFNLFKQKWAKRYFKENQGFSTINEVKQIFENELQTTTNITASLKLRNTIEYVDYLSTL